jgi:hypothetical protein
VSVVTVMRHRDPLEGQSLRVLGRLRRHGGLELLLVLPDGSKRMVPAAWTDLDSGLVGERHGDGVDVAATLERVGDLLAACRLVLALVTGSAHAQGQAARTSSCEEDDRAACAVEFDPPGGPSEACRVGCRSHAGWTSGLRAA